MLTVGSVSLGLSLLTAYLSERGLRRAELAERLSCSRAFVTMLLKGKRTPGRTVAFDIQRLTDGAVPASSWDEKCGTRRAPRKAPRGRRAV